MFKKIKKLYFKIYHLFKLLGCFLIFFFIFSSFVNADECVNLLDLDNANWYFTYQNGFLVYYSLDGSSPSYLNIQANTTYTLFVPNNSYNSLSDYFCTGFNYCGLGARIGTYGFNLNSKAPTYNYIFSGTMTFAFTGLTGDNVQSFVSTLNNKEITPYFVLGIECTPPIPPSPSPSSPLSDFIDIFLDRFSFLASSTFSFPYLFDFIVVIFSFAVLFLTLRIINIKRRR